MIRDSENGSLRSILWAVLSITVIVGLFTVTIVRCQDKPVWTAADRLSDYGGISLFRYGALGQGTYPYRQSAVMADMKVTLNGVPLRSRSPFGPDLDLIPAIFTGTASYDGWNTLAFSLHDTIPDEPVTETRFLMGSRQRFNLDMLYRRATSERSVLTVGGSSTGIQGHYTGGTDAFIPKYNFRDYMVDYYREQANGSQLHVTVRGFRDRDEIADLDSLRHMGERKTDELTISANLDNIPLSNTTTLSNTLYYINSNTRFARYGLRKSLDEDVMGFTSTIDKVLGDTSYQLRAFHEWTIFDSRIHNVENDFHESVFDGTFSFDRGLNAITMSGGVMYHSEYGSGAKARVQLKRRFTDNTRFIARGEMASLYPNPADEYYTSLVFSDSSVVNNLDKGKYLSVEAGFQFEVPGGEFEIMGFGSKSEGPVFRASDASMDYSGIRFTERPPYHSTQVYINENHESRGGRVYWKTMFNWWAEWNISSQTTARFDHIKSTFWFYPKVESVLDGMLIKDFIDGKLHVCGYGTASVKHWLDDSGVLGRPSGTYFFLDAGINIRVATLELFYEIENVTSEDVFWFDVLQWQGRNSMYGGRWVFYQ